MSIEEFSKHIYEEMETLTEAESDNSMEAARRLYFIILKTITKLRDFFIEYRFENKNEEINFFRNIKPKFLSKLIYYRKIFDIESSLPVGLSADIIAYYLHVLDTIKNYIESNKEFFTYYRSHSSLLDEIYFVRKEPDLWLSLNSEDCEQDNFATIYDHKLSKLLAYERISVFLIEAINKQSSTEVGATTHKITWTGSKVSLIELLYALQTSGACNNGTADVKDIADHFEHLFNVKLGNFYRTFQEIRIRKISRTTFLDQLKENLIKRMDNSDENPRY
jgi:hypothetical protein